MYSKSYWSEIMYLEYIQSNGCGLHDSDTYVSWAFIVVSVAWHDKTVELIIMLG